MGGEATLLRSLAGPHESPLGEVVAIASAHDGVAGTERGPNTIVVFGLDSLRIAHFGDFGQPALRPEQRAHLEGVDLVSLPVGGGPTIGGATAAGIATQLAAIWAVPMHYRTEKINFLGDESAFVEAMPRSERLSSSSFDTAALERRPEPTAIVLAAPWAPRSSFGTRGCKGRWSDGGGGAGARVGGALELVGERLEVGPLAVAALQ